MGRASRLAERRRLGILPHLPLPPVVAVPLAVVLLDYGYYWWLRGSGRTFSYSAAGSGGNLICCIPGQDLVVAIAAKVVLKSCDPWLPVEQCILPAIRD